MSVSMLTPPTEIEEGGNLHGGLESCGEEIVHREPEWYFVHCCVQYLSQCLAHRRFLRHRTGFIFILSDSIFRLIETCL